MKFPRCTDRRLTPSARRDVNERLAAATHDASAFGAEYRILVRGRDRWFWLRWCAGARGWRYAGFVRFVLVLVVLTAGCSTPCSCYSNGTVHESSQAGYQTCRKMCSDVAI